MRFCSKCGAPCNDSTNFCPECGSPLTPNNNTQTNYNQSSANTGNNTQNYNHTPNYNGSVNYNHMPNNSRYPGIVSRSIPVAIILSLITCGIYGIYWMIKINDEVNEIAGEPQATSGGMVFLFSLITCGIYGLYWLYKMGERCDRIKGINGNSGLLYLVLAIFGLSIVSYCLIQDTINKAI